MKKAEDEKLKGTHLQGQISEDYKVLVSVFGEPEHWRGGDKVSCEWAIQFDDGTIATIYDWKSSPAYIYKEYNESGGVLAELQSDWHVGGHGIEALIKVKDAIRQHKEES